MKIIPDISFWQDDPTTPKGIDFDKMRSQTSAVIIRTGQNLWVDNEFKISWTNAKRSGLNRGSYWFYDSRANPKRQAELWVNTLGNDTGELALFCDFEDRYGGQWHGWRNWHDLMERLKVLLPDKMLFIYTNYYYWKENTSPPLCTVAQREYFRQYPLWIANYNPVDKPMIPEPFDTWMMWQYTDNGDGKPYGVESRNIDLNYFNGTENEFNQFFGVTDNPPPAPNGKIIEARFGNKLVEYKEVTK